MNNPDKNKIEKAVKDLILAIGDDPDRDGLKDTPARVARMWCDEFPKRKMIRMQAFMSSYNEIVIVKDIPFASLCEHHLLPFTGVANIAYIPNGVIVGLSKLARIVDHYSLRLNIQERLTEQVADHIESELKPIGVAVIIECQHLCMVLRGVQKPGHKTITSCLRGKFMDDPVARNELLQLISIAK